MAARTGRRTPGSSPGAPSPGSSGPGQLTGHDQGRVGRRRLALGGVAQGRQGWVVAGRPIELGQRRLPHLAERDPLLDQHLGADALPFPRLQRRAERDQGLAQEVTALRQRLDEMERRLAALEGRERST
jgi:hypothetical protein